MSYEGLAHVIKLGGTVMFFAVFVCVIAYALWPKNKAKFDRAASMALEDDDAPKIDDNKG